MDTTATAPGAATPPDDLLAEDSQFAIAMRRIQGQDAPVDPQSAVAPFNSAF